MGAGTRTRAKLNVRPRPLVVNATGAIQKNNTLIDPKPRTHTKQATTPISKCSQLSHTHAVELATLKCSLLNAVSHLLFPTSLFLSVLVHVFALSSSLGMKILLHAFPLSSSSTPQLSTYLTFISFAFPSQQEKPSRFLTLHVCSSSSSFPRCIFHGFHHVFFTLSLLLGYSSLSLSFLFLPLASPSFFPNVACVLAVAPALCAPARVARAMASDFHANLNVAAGVVSGTLTACGSTPLAVWGALPKRRGNAGSDSELPYHMNTFLEVRWDCVSLPSLLSHALPFCSLLLFFVFVFAFSSSLSYLLPLCTSTSSSSPPLLLLGVFLLFSRLLLTCFRLS